MGLPWVDLTQALAVAHEALAGRLLTFDRDFERFAGLRLRHLA